MKFRHLNIYINRTNILFIYTLIEPIYNIYNNRTDI